jgi:hypothetical protein
MITRWKASLIAGLAIALCFSLGMPVADAATKSKAGIAPLSCNSNIVTDVTTVNHTRTGTFQVYQHSSSPTSTGSGRRN